jgi:hypothetical protein
MRADCKNRGRRHKAKSATGRPGTGTLRADGAVEATNEMDRTLPMILQWDESFDISSDTLTGVNDDDYSSPFPLTAKLNKLTIKVDRPQLSPEDINKLQATMREKAQSDRNPLLPHPETPARSAFPALCMA